MEISILDLIKSTIVNIFADNQLLLLFTIIGLGYLLGNIKILGIKLGVAAVLFVGIGFGVIDRQIDLPEHIYIIGLVLFVYAIGLQSGTGFFASFQRRGIRINLISIALLCMGALVAIIIYKIMGISGPSVAGLFCGALTNTPALAATIETIKELSVNLPKDMAELYITSPIVTYGLAYPFGVLGLILWFFIFSKIFKVDYSKEESSRLPESASEVILTRTYRVTNPAVLGKTIEQAMVHFVNPGFVLSRIKKNDQVTVVLPATVLSKNDLVVAVGTMESLERAQILFGESLDEDLVKQPSPLTYRRIFVSNKAVIGKSIRELQLHRRFDANITRLRRVDVDFVPTPDTVLESGDRIRVVCQRENIDAITEFFGDSMKSISETDFLSLSLGIVLGVFVGMIPFPMPGGMTFKLGFAGGPLIVGLILGKLERTGPITWGLPFSANLVLRQIGLVFFLATIGTTAGHGFSATFHTGGLGLIIAGACITSTVTIATIIVGHKFLKLPMTAIMGMMSGMQTQPATLAYAVQQTESETPNVWYATVYPASMIAKVILAQIIVSALLMR